MAESKVQEISSLNVVMKTVQETSAPDIRRTFMSRKNSWAESHGVVEDFINHSDSEVVANTALLTRYRVKFGKRVFFAEVGLAVTAVFFTILHLLSTFYKHVDYAVTLAVLAAAAMGHTHTHQYIQICMYKHIYIC